VSPVMGYADTRVSTWRMQAVLWDKPEPVPQGHASNTYMHTVVATHIRTWWHRNCESS